MSKKSLDLTTIITPDNLATQIAETYQTWNSLRQAWKHEKRELRNYVFATDTSTTSNHKLPWSNSTTTPKLTQIYDNLKANYSAALFPNSNWMTWEGNDEDSVSKAKANVIQAYIEDKIEQSKFRTTMDRLVDDFILYGNCFAMVEHADEVVETASGPTVVYTGPRVKRISPYDIVFDPTAASFEDTPKIIRSIMGLGEARKFVSPEVFEDMQNARREVGSSTQVDKSDAYIADGFSTIEMYYRSGHVEFLTFYGDIYDVYEEVYHENKRITIADRAYVVAVEDVESWLGRPPITHAGWRSRPDNLWAMGPLDNLVGMQYRIDHLENLKADVFDQIALPLLKIRGDVEDFEYQPGERIIMGDEGDVMPLVPDATALNADFQIQTLENKMEELAGAPRQAMGIRTPGEKTAFEVQSLENSAGRIFQHKAEKFEVEFVEPILNNMLEVGRRYMGTKDSIRLVDEETSVVLFKTITEDDIKAKGNLKPKGARHFAERAQRIQNLNNMQMASQDPKVGAHISGKVIARILAEELGEEELFSENIAVQEQLKTQQAVQNAEAENVETLAAQEEAGL